MKRLVAAILYVGGVALTATLGALVAGEMFASSVAYFLGGFLAAAAALPILGLALVRLRVLQSQRLGAVTIGAAVGLVCSMVLWFFTALTVFHPAIGFLMVGLGVLIADIDAASNERRRARCTELDPR